jgi:hypothetical protein
MAWASSVNAAAAVPSIGSARCRRDPARYVVDITGALIISTSVERVANLRKVIVVLRHVESMTHQG